MTTLWIDPKWMNMKYLNSLLRLLSINWWINIKQLYSILLNWIIYVMKMDKFKWRLNLLRRIILFCIIYYSQIHCYCKIWSLQFILLNQIITKVNMDKDIWGLKLKVHEFILMNNIQLEREKLRVYKD